MGLAIILLCIDRDEYSLTEVIVKRLHCRARPVLLNEITGASWLTWEVEPEEVFAKE